MPGGARPEAGRPYAECMIFAYLDPGSGSLFIQALIALVMAAPPVAAIYWVQRRRRSN